MGTAQGFNGCTIRSASGLSQGSLGRGPSGSQHGCARTQLALNRDPVGTQWGLRWNSPGAQ
eukprot:2437107-Alexandrium_andersonii.AAC.1